MYTCSSKTIELCVGSPEFTKALINAWYFPFGEPIGLKGDHQTLGFDSSIYSLFHHQPANIVTPIICSVNSNNRKLIKKFCNKVIEHCEDANIYEQIHQLNVQTMFNPDHHAKLEAINTDLAKILVDADQECVKKGTYPCPLHFTRHT